MGRGLGWGAAAFSGAPLAQARPGPARELTLKLTGVHTQLVGVVSPDQTGYRVRVVQWPTAWSARRPPSAVALDWRSRAQVEVGEVGLV